MFILNFSVFVWLLSVMSSRKKRVCDCGQKFSVSDKHTLCVACRACSRMSMCDICSVWSQKEWSTFSPTLDVIDPASQGADTPLVRGDSQPSGQTGSVNVSPSDVQVSNATGSLLVPPQTTGSVPIAEVFTSSTVTGDVTQAPLFTQTQTATSCVNVVFRMCV